MRKVLRSLIQEKLPFDFRLKLEILADRSDIVNSQKQDELFNLIREFNIEGVVPLGAGTNRYAFKLNGFVIKVATNSEGKLDNLKEFKMCKTLSAFGNWVIRCYEVSQNGTLLVTEYVQPFESYSEMMQYKNEIREILSKVSDEYFIGDIGITSKNYANWGLRVGTNEPVCLDFAYVFDVNSDILTCKVCKENAILSPDEDFNYLICTNPACRHKYDFSMLRSRISESRLRAEIGNLEDVGYKINAPQLEVELDETRSAYLQTKKIKPKHEQKLVEEIPPEYKEEIEMTAGIENKTNEAEVIINATARIDEDEIQQEQVEKGSIFDINIDLAARVLPEDEEDENEDEEDYSDDVEIDESLLVSEEEFEKQIHEAIAEVDNEEAEEVTAKTDPTIDEIINLVSDSFLDNQLTVISRLSNYMEQSVTMRYDLFNMIRKHLKFKMTENEFMKAFQNAIFRSLIQYLGIEETKITNADNKQQTKFIPVLNKENKYEKGRELADVMLTYAFISNLWEYRFLPKVDMNPNYDIVASYSEQDNDGFAIQREWVEVFINRLSSKVTIAQDGLDIISSIMMKLFCPVYAPQDNFMNPPVEDNEEDNGIEIIDNPVEPEPEVSDDTILRAATGEIDEPSDPVDIYDETVNSFNSSEAVEPGYDEDHLLINTDGNGITVIVNPVDDEDNYDRIYIKCNCHQDELAAAIIPIYEKIGEFDEDQEIPMEGDPSNLYLSWLTAFEPIKVHYTSNPDAEMRINYSYGQDEENQVYMINLGYDENKQQYLMGTYLVNDIFVVNADGEPVTAFEEDLMVKLDLIIRKNIAGTAISHYKRTWEEIDRLSMITNEELNDEALDSIVDMVLGHDGDQNSNENIAESAEENSTPDVNPHCVTPEQVGLDIDDRPENPNVKSYTEPGAAIDYDGDMKPVEGLWDPSTPITVTQQKPKTIEEEVDEIEKQINEGVIIHPIRK
jgi:hypothetical protein